MSRRVRLIAAVAAALLAGPAPADPPGLKPLPIGAAAPDFVLPGVDGRTYSLKDFADACESQQIACEYAAQEGLGWEPLPPARRQPPLRPAAGWCIESDIPGRAHARFQPYL